MLVSLSSCWAARNRKTCFCRETKRKTFYSFTAFISRCSACGKEEDSVPMTEPQNRNPREKDSCFCFGLFFVLLAFVLFPPFLSHQHQHPHASPTDYTNPFFSCPSLVPFLRHSFFLFFLMLSREHPQRRRSFDFKSFRKRTCQQQNGVSYDRQKTESSTLRRERNDGFPDLSLQWDGKGSRFSFHSRVR